MDHEYFYPCSGFCEFCKQITREENHDLYYYPGTESNCIIEGSLPYWTCGYGCEHYWLDEACTQPVEYSQLILPLADHIYDGVCDPDCNLCADVREAEEHTYDNACDIDCNGCGLLRTVGDHVYPYACSTVCAECGTGRTTDVDHIYDHIYDADCNTCGQLRDVEIVVGDADGDGEASLVDAVTLQRYLNGWDEIVLDPAADINGDGRLNNKDLVLLIRLLSGFVA